MPHARPQIREQLPDSFQKAEYLRDHGMVDIVVHRKEMKTMLGRLLGLLMFREPSADVVTLPQPDLEIPRQSADAKPETTRPGGTRTAGAELVSAELVSAEAANPDDDTPTDDGIPASDRT